MFTAVSAAGRYKEAKGGEERMDGERVEQSVFLNIRSISQRKLATKCNFPSKISLFYAYGIALKLVMFQHLTEALYFQFLLQGKWFYQLSLMQSAFVECLM